VPDRVALLVCEHLQEEARRSIGPAIAGDVELSVYPAACGRARQRDDAAMRSAVRLAADGFDVHVIGGSCLAAGHPTEPPAPGVHLHCVDPCAKLFVSGTVADRLVDGGAYLVTPGWLRTWKQVVREWGFDDATARDFFRDSASSIALIDTLHDAASPGELRELADFVGIPADVIPAGLDLLSGRLDGIVESWRWQRERGAFEAARSASNRRIADHRLVHDVLGKIVTIRSEADLVAAMFDTFSMLFAPETMVYRPLHHGKAGEAVPWPAEAPTGDPEPLEAVGPDAPCAWTRSGNGFTLYLRHAAEALASVELRQIACPQFREHYQELAVTLAQMCGLAIAYTRGYQELKHMARTDELTGVANRRRFFEVAERQFSLARRHGYRLCVVMLDIDHFKSVNDTHGHAMGDAVLRRVARTCQHAVRATDVLGRYGGEEFAVVLHATDEAGARLAAERMRRSVEELTFETPLGTLRVTISLGVAESAPGRELEPEIVRADAALYAAKTTGRNRVCCADPPRSGP
jgi:diguanylate cyclase (GGDEF)-like protein